MENKDNNQVSVKMSIRDVQNVTYDEELSEKLGAICHTGDIITTECKTFRHIIEHDGHTWLIESNYEFQQMTFDKKDGYVIKPLGSYIREITLKDEEADSELPTKDEIRQLFTHKIWVLNTDPCFTIYVNGFSSPENIVKYRRFLPTIEDQLDRTCSFKDFFMMFEPWKEGIRE